jgi:N-acetylglucosamine kinase
MQDAVPDTGPILAADIGGSYIRMAAVTSPSHGPGRIVRRKTPTDDADAFFATMAEVAADLSAPDEPGIPLVMAVAGTIDPDSEVLTTANIPCLNGIAPGRELSRRLDRPAFTVNDAEAFALSEAVVGLGKGHQTVFGAILGTGIGGATIIDGHIVGGKGGVAGEWGHGPIANQHPIRLGRTLPRMTCGCGQAGCVDTFGGARGLERLHRSIGHETASSRTIIGRWKDGSDDAALTIEVWAELVSEPLALAVNITGASIVPVGGGIGSEPALIALLDREVRARILRSETEPLVVTGTIGDDAALIGAAILGRQLMASST